MTGDRRRAAIAYAERGWAVFPCGTPTGDHGHPAGSVPDCEPCKAEKAPRRGWKWKERNSSDPDVIRAHWPDDDPNVGVACAASRLVVVDLDTAAHGTLPEEWRLPGVNDGADVLAVLVENAGEAFPFETFNVRTASGGWHYYFRAVDGRPIPNSAGKVAPMVDVRGDRNADGTPGGGYVVGAGSVVGGASYTPVYTPDALPLPDWIADLAAPPATAPTPRTYTPATGDARPHSRFVGLLDTVLSAPKGQRNNVVHWAACRAAEMVREGLVTWGSAHTALLDAGTAIGLSEREVHTTLGSAFGRAA